MKIELLCWYLQKLTDRGAGGKIGCEEGDGVHSYLAYYCSAFENHLPLVKAPALGP